MRYRVAFAKRFQSDGRESRMDPSAELDVYLADGVVAEKVFVERLETEAQHSQEVLDEDDAFLGSAAPEVWEYEVVDERASEFEDAIRNSEVALEFEVIDTTPTDPEEATEVSLEDGDAFAPEGGNYGRDVTRSGSGVRGGDDGPAGEPTGDPSAGGFARSAPYLGIDEVEGIGEPGSSGIDDLNIVKANDPRLGLTNRGEKPPEDWAANTGPTREADRGIATDSPLDDSSTLAPPKKKRRR